MMQLNPLARISISVAVIAAIIAVYVFSVVWLHKKSDGIAAERQAVVEMTRELENIHTLRAQVEAGKELESTFSQHLVARTDIVNFIKEVESLGNQTGAYITIDAIDSSISSGGDEKIVPANFKLSIRGSWNAVTRTLMLVENLPYLGKIGGINFEYFNALTINDSRSESVQGGATPKAQAGWKVDFNYTFRLMK